MNNIEKELNLIDNKIVELVKKRLEILGKGNKSLNDKELKELTLNFLDESNHLLLNNNSKLKILYLGPEGSYTEDAAVKKFGNSCNFISINSITNMFEELNKNNADYAVIPIENSLNGLVNDTINAFLKYDLFAVDEIVLDIHHTFASNCENLSDIKKIYSKDIAFSQCSKFLEKYNLHNVEQVYVESTTKAAVLASQDKQAAAICSKVAAIKNKVTIQFEDIEDDSSNKTRFLVLSKNYNEFKNFIDYKTSFLIKLPNYAGSLIEFLEKFREKNINLYKIKSHITQGVSNFFIEFDGHFQDENVKDIFSDYINDVKIIGSYKKIIDDI